MLARALLLSLAIVSTAPPAASVAAEVQRRVDGLNVTRVFHSGGGSFEQLENNRWIEFADDGTLIHSFDETGRTRDAVSLYDPSRGARVRLNLRDRTISGIPRTGGPRLLYRITDVDADRRGRGWRGRRGGGGGDWGRGSGDDNRGQRYGTRDIEVGPIWNQRDAETKCRNKAREMRAEWTGQWHTTIQGRMSVCELRFR